MSSPPKGDIHVGSDVWIGRDAKILSGVKINDGAVIWANSLVTKDVLLMPSLQEILPKLLNIDSIMKLLKSYLRLNGGTLKKKNL